jgi:hypothetical protein
MNNHLTPTSLRHILVLAYILVFNLPLHSQHAIPAAGGDYQTVEGSVSFSLGQIFYENFSVTDGSIVQGVQQPYDISIVSEVEDAPAISLNFSAYPNPAGDYLFLEIKGELKAPCLLYLYDINGKLLQNLTVTIKQTRVDMSRYKPAVYFLKVIEGQKKVKVFQIVKN